jgi:3-phosphoshikimate 1-carboxyvinyltransferase
MTQERVSPASRVDGDIKVPGDKSISHRALILGALAKGRSYIGNASPAADVLATAACLRACGVWIRDFPPDRFALDGGGVGMSLVTPESALDCANSGTTMRLLAGVLAGADVDATLDGDASLRRRPMRRVADPLRAMGATVDVSAQGTAPLRVRGKRVLEGVTWQSPVASAQVKSAILLAGLSADGPTTVIEPLPTRDHTERMLRMCGIDVAADDTAVTVHPGQLEPFGLRVPGDLSSAAFFFALAAARPGWRLACPGLGLNPGRTGILMVLEAMGAGLQIEPRDPAGGVEPVGDVEVRGAALHGIVISDALTVRCIDASRSSRTGCGSSASPARAPPTRSLSTDPCDCEQRIWTRRATIGSPWPGRSQPLWFPRAVARRSSREPTPQRCRIPASSATWPRSWPPDYSGSKRSRRWGPSRASTTFSQPTAIVTGSTSGPST